MTSRRQILAISGILAALLFFVLILLTYLYMPSLVFKYLEKTSYVDDVRYASDGKHIFFVEHTADSLEDPGKDTLYYSESNRENKRKIYDAPGFYVSIISPDDRYLIIETSRGHLLVDNMMIDTRSGRMVQKMDLSVGNELYHKWFPSTKKILCSDTNGVYLLNLKTQKREYILEDDKEAPPEEGAVPLAWSEDGSYLVYNRGWYVNGSKLYLYDLDHKTSKLLLSALGEFEYALYDDSKGTVYVALVNKRDLSADIISINIDNLKKQLLWSRKSKSQVTPIAIDKPMFTSNGKYIIFNSQSDTIDGDKNDAIWLLLISDKKAKKIIQTTNYTWDYSPKTNKVIWWDENAETLKEKEVKL